MPQGLSPAEIIDLAIALTASENYWDMTNPKHIVKLYLALNMGHKDVYNRIVDLDKNYFRESRLADSVAGQSEYPLERTFGAHPGMYKIEKFYAKYEFGGVYNFFIRPGAAPVVGDVYTNNMTKFTIQSVNGPLVVAQADGKYVPSKSGILQRVSGTGTPSVPYDGYTPQSVEEFGTRCRITDWDVNMFQDPDYYSVHQPTADPFCLISDKSIFVYPAPIRAIPDGLKFQGTKMPIRLTSDMKEDAIIVPRQHHELIAYATAPHLCRFMLLPDRKAEAMADYEKEAEQQLAYLSTRQTTPVYGTKQELNRKFE